MQPLLISHSPDLAQLIEEGFDIVVDGSYLIVHQLPYVDMQNNIRYGSLICILTLATPTQTGVPADHTSYFRGEFPCDATGTPLTGLVNSSNKQYLTPDISVDHYLSSKPAGGGYSNYYEKVSTYAKIIGSHAQVLDSKVTWKPLMLQDEK